MNRIYRDATGVWMLDSYFEYLESIKQRLPDHIKRIFCIEERYYLSGEESFHDAWVNSIAIEQKINDHQEVVPSINLRLLHQSHQKYFDISYEEIEDFECSLSLESICTIGDLLVHEFELLEEGSMLHQMTFSSGSTIRIQFGRISLTELSV